MLNALSALSAGEWLTAISGLTASLLAIWNDTRPHEEPGGARKGGLTGAGVVALVLALVSFGLAIREFQQEAESRTADAKRAELIENIDAQVTRALPASISKAMETAQGSITAMVRSTNEKLNDSLKNTINYTGQRLDGRIAASVEKTGDELARVVTSTSGTITETVTGAVKSGLANTKTEIEKVVTDQTNAAANSTADKIARSADETSKRMRGALLQAVSDTVAQVPLTVLDHTTRRLPGALDDLHISVDNISNDHEFTVQILKGTEPLLVTDGTSAVKRTKLTVNPKAVTARNQAHTLRLEYGGRMYRIEMVVHAPSNFFGQSPDMLLCQIILEREALTESAVVPINHITTN